MRTGIALRTLPISEKKAKRAAVADDVEEAPEPAADTLDSSKKRRREAEAEVSAPKCKSKWVLFCCRCLGATQLVLWTLQLRRS